MRKFLKWKTVKFSMLVYVHVYVTILQLLRSICYEKRWNGVKSACLYFGFWHYFVAIDPQLMQMDAIGLRHWYNTWPFYLESLRSQSKNNEVLYTLYIHTHIFFISLQLLFSYMGAQKSWCIYIYISLLASFCRQDEYNIKKICYQTK